MDHCLRSRDYVNVVVSGKQPTPTWLGMEDAVLHCARGIGIWDWASTDDGDPEVVLACAGDMPTLRDPGGHRHPAGAAPGPPGAWSTSST